jgi:hypothetical protein
MIELTWCGSAKIVSQFCSSQKCHRDCSVQFNAFASWLDRSAFLININPQLRKKIRQRKASIPNKESLNFRQRIAKLSKRLGDTMMRTKWSLTIHHEDRGERSIIAENKFNNFADVHATMKRNKGKIFVVKIPKTAKPMEVRAFHNLKQLGYLVEAQ